MKAFYTTRAVLIVGLFSLPTIPARAQVEGLQAAPNVAIQMQTLNELYLAAEQDKAKYLYRAHIAEDALNKLKAEQVQAAKAQAEKDKTAKGDTK